LRKHDGGEDDDALAREIGRGRMHKVLVDVVVRARGVLEKGAGALHALCFTAVLQLRDLALDAREVEDDARLLECDRELRRRLATKHIQPRKRHLDVLMHRAFSCVSARACVRGGDKPGHSRGIAGPAAPADQSSGTTGPVRSCPCPQRACPAKHTAFSRPKWPGLRMSPLPVAVGTAS